MEALKEFLKELKVPADVLKALTAEETPEGFDIKAAAENYHSTRKELWKAKEGDAINGSIKAEKAKWMNTIKNKLRKPFDISSNDSKGMDMDQMLEAIQANVNLKVETARTSTNEDLVKEANEYKAKWQAMADQFDQVKTEAEKKVEAERAKAEKAISEFQIKNLKTKIYSGLDLSDTIGRENAQIIIDNVLSKQYRITGTGEIQSTTGTQAISLDGERIYQTPKEAIEDIARVRNLLKVSNGGESGSSGTQAGKPNPEKLSDHARAMLERAQAASKKRRGMA